MRRGCIAFLIMGVIAATHFSCKAATEFDSIMTGESWDISENIILSEHAIINVDNINITNSIYLENHGNLNSDIFICDGCELYVRNNGNISGTFYSGDGGHVTQVIKNSDDITRLDFSGTNFSVLVQAEEALYLSDIMKIAFGADKIILHNTTIMLGGNLVQSRFFSFANSAPRSIHNPTIELVGTITINLKDLKVFSGRPILSNVSGDGVVEIYAPDLDPLYVAQTYIKDNDVYFQINRETDYVKLLGPPRGHFLNKLRNIFPDDETIAALDVAQTMSELQDVVHRSIMFNPINLMRPIKLFNNFEMASNFPQKNEHSLIPELSIESIYIMTDDIGLKGGKASFVVSVENVDLSAALYGAFFDHSGDLNNFSGIMYGGNIQARYVNKSLFINTMAGVTLSEFETGIIFDGRGAIINPSGLSVYGAVDIGSRFLFENGFYTSPYLGTVAEYDNVLNQTEMSILGRVGAYSGYEFCESGICYDYEIRTILETNGDVGFGVGISFWSESDGAGGGVRYGLQKDALGFSHKLSADIKFTF